MPRLTDKDKAAVSQSVKHAKLVDASRRLARIVRHTDPPTEVKAERDLLEADLQAWIIYHGGEAFDRPFSEDHVKAITRIEAATNDGGLFALAMPRGHGKTTILKWTTLYCLLTGRRHYVIVVAATGELAQSIVEFCRQQITESDTLHEHYPHVTTYARATDGKAIKAKYQLRADGKSSGIQWSKTTLVMPESLSPETGEPYPCNGGILEGHGLTGAIRGKWKDRKSGKVIRPDFVILDDPQTRESAESNEQCNKRERIINGDVLGLAGPRKRIAAVMPCTIIRKGDLASRFLDHDLHPEWQGETTSLVKTWPTAQETLWTEYTKIYRDEVAEGRGTTAATLFYEEHRAEMDAGAVASWEHRIRDGEVSAIQTAENLLIESGDQFWAEYQNEPLQEGVTVYSLTPDVIVSRITKRTPGEVPDWSRVRVVATDINPSYGLTWALLSFGADQTAGVLGYGIHEMGVAKGATEAETAQAIYEHLVLHGKYLAGLPCRPETWMIDAGGSAFDVVHRFCRMSAQSCGLQAIPCTGRNAAKYRPYGKSVIGKPREQCHMASDVNGRKWIAFNADYWREVAQKSWTGSVGAPGSCSLPVGNHREFAEQICKEQLVGKADIGGMVWKWNTQPGRHDFGDCMYMAFVGAAWQGIGTGGTGARPAKPPPRRQCRVAMAENPA